VVVAAAANTSPKALKAAFAGGLGVVKGLGVTHLAVQALGFEALQSAHAEAMATAWGDAVYVYRTTKPSAAAAPKLEKLTVLAGTKPEANELNTGLVRGAAIVEGVTLARELANRPGNHCTPRLLADEARKMAKAQGLRIEVLDHKAIEKVGMGSFLSVAQGSDEPPRFIVMHYQGAAKSVAPVVLVGKGITFDTGGISLKPGAEMDEMKFDMGGAASVIGTMRAIAELKPKVNVIGVIAAAENMPSGRAVKPGDVVTSLSGQTIEILNTDAEGRLILCDALSYVERFKPAAVVDIATLTGACVIALGHVRSGLFSADDGLAAELQAAGDAALDTCWRMPVDEEYDEGLKSNFADMANIAGRAGGSITAAMFLKRFTSKLRWAHLDIAGTAWKSGAAKGATGRPVGLLTHYVLSQAK
jgi:leucyl aminopeptidase